MFVFSFKYLIKTLAFPVLLTDRTHSLFADLRLSQPGRVRVGREAIQAEDRLAGTGLHTGGLTLTPSLMDSCPVFWVTAAGDRSCTHLQDRGLRIWELPRTLALALGLVLHASAPDSIPGTPRLDPLSHVHTWSVRNPLVSFLCKPHEHRSVQ